MLPIAFPRPRQHKCGIRFLLAFGVLELQRDRQTHRQITLKCSIERVANGKAMECREDVNISNVTYRIVVAAVVLKNEK